jgi:hypothetical protein
LGKDCSVGVDVALILAHCRVVHKILYKTLDDLRTGDRAQVISKKSLHKLTRGLVGDWVQIFRADCLVAIMENKMLQMSVESIYRLMMHSKDELIMLHMLLRAKLPKVLSVVDENSFRAEMLRLHKKYAKVSSDEIAWYETNRVRRLCAEWN